MNFKQKGSTLFLQSDHNTLPPANTFSSCIRGPSCPGSLSTLLATPFQAGPPPAQPLPIGDCISLLIYPSGCNAHAGTMSPKLTQPIGQAWHLHPRPTHPRLHSHSSHPHRVPAQPGSGPGAGEHSRDHKQTRSPFSSLTLRPHPILVLQTEQPLSSHSLTMARRLGACSSHTSCHDTALFTWRPGFGFMGEGARFLTSRGTGGIDTSW